MAKIVSNPPSYGMSIKLSEDLTVDVIEAKGRHFMAASKKMGDEEERFVGYLMAEICRVEGQKKPIEYFEDLPMSQFVKILTELTEAGFISQ